MSTLRMNQIQNPQPSEEEGQGDGQASARPNDALRLGVSTYSPEDRVRDRVYTADVSSQYIQILLRIWFHLDEAFGGYTHGLGTSCSGPHRHSHRRPTSLQGATRPASGRS